MSSHTILHALNLHLYQPAGNLRALLREDPEELKRILLCYERIARHAHKYSAVARLHVALSPVLLEQLADPELIEDCRELADIPAILDSLRSAAAIEFVGSGYRHAPLPLIPQDDWDEQLRRERTAMEAVLGRVPKGYWPPAGLFSAEMIPALVKAGYQYLLLPAGALAMADGAGADPYRPYRLCHKKVCIPVVPLDGGFSGAQENGLDAPWFADAVRDGVAQAPASDAPYLLGTWSDGENGEWFRRIDEEWGFFGQFFSPYMEFCETGEFPVRPAFLSEYLHAFPPKAEAHLRPADPASTLKETERASVKKVAAASARYWSLARGAAGREALSAEALLQARDLVLQAEESGLLLGETPHQAQLLELLDQAERLMSGKPARAASEPAKRPAPTPKTEAAPAKTRPVTAAPPAKAPPQPTKPTIVPATATPEAKPAAPVASAPPPATPVPEPKAAVPAAEAAKAKTVPAKSEPTEAAKPVAQPPSPPKPAAVPAQPKPATAETKPTEAPAATPSAPKQPARRKPPVRGKAKTRTTRARKPGGKR